MIPLKLQIKNFVSYGPKTQTIDFGAYNLICLSGKNGHGKSALLDALTWSIWGQARKISGSSRSDEALLHLGQTSMMVVLDFLCMSVQYRIRREFTQLSGKKSCSSLEFGIIDNQSGIFKPLTEKTIRDTQSKIEKIVGLDYDSFINSAFLRQGQSNEFSKKSPGDRKEVLANILGLNRFENIKKLALQRTRDSINIRDYSIQICTQLEKELASKIIIKDQLSQIINDIENLSQEEHILKDRLKDIKKAQESIITLKSKAQQIYFEKEQLATSIKVKTEDILKDFNKWRTVFRKSKNFQNIEQIDQIYNRLVLELKDLQIIIRERVNVKEQLFTKKEKFYQYVQNITQEFNTKLDNKKLELKHNQISLKNLEEKLEELEKTYSEDLCQLQKLNQELNLLISQNFSYDEIKNINDNIEKELYIFDRRKSYYSKFEAQIFWNQNQLKDLESKIVLIEKDSQASCPLCLQNLNSDYKDNLNINLEQDKLFLNNRLNKLKHLTSKLRDILTQQNDKIIKLKYEIERYNIFQVKKESTEKDIEKLNELIKHKDNEIIRYRNLIANQKMTLDKVIQDIKLNESQFESTVLNDITYKSLKSEIDNLDSYLNSINIDEQKEVYLIAEIHKLEEIKKEQAYFLSEFALQQDRQDKIGHLIAEVKELKKFKKEKESQYQELNFVFEKELLLQNQEYLIDQKLQEISLKKEKLILQQGSIAEQDKILDQKNKEYNDQKCNLDTLSREIEDYKAISTALGKDGIQALLIEDAIPEIENEANILLGRMTDNQSHIIIESLKDLKSGGTKETLDIKISDPLGLRPYELFSGGEAFKIDFALRIAISKLLARRAGASLQTLIIDEGFGSQDEEGLAHIMNIIYKIQEDFEKIIVVSHLNSMKEQFPVHFLVHKTPQGSLIKVVEQG
ncbi:AAA family ATPase [Candidatus Babela massiliensis]|uniref:ATPase involved in DNA repair SbcC n=1 Tax=Candidatus Babela massiliensis TaxID=673862 RepID=V6DHE8_9BACT|nr:SMC family ATPase [Candidatus Babela massiliensis]CDK31012.1 ATPase involved in DNA repair SbcC [Candidatus Babela massiliensis]